MATRALTRTLAVAVLAAAMAACGAGDDEGDGAGGAAGTGAGTAPPGASDGATGDGGGATGRFACALTAEEVGGVLGTTLGKDAVTCAFAPGGELGRLPSVLFVPYASGTCTEEVAGQLGYTDPVQVAGADAWAQTGGMVDAQLLVCSDAPFEVQVDLVEDDADAALGAADALARLAVGSA